MKCHILHCLGLISLIVGTSCIIVRLYNNGRSGTTTDPIQTLEEIVTVVSPELLQQQQQQNQENKQIFLNENNDKIHNHNRTTTTTSFITNHRSLAIGDYQSLNDLFEGRSIRLPDVSDTYRVLFAEVTASFENIYCTNLFIGDIVLDSTLQQQQNNNNNNQQQKEEYYRVESNILQITADCDMDYKYESGSLNGDGRSSMKFIILIVDSITDYTNEFFSFDNYPPTIKDVTSCQSNVQASDVQFEGSGASLLNAASGLIETLIENEIEDVVCKEIAPVATGIIDGIIDIGNETIVPYLEPLSSSVTNPVYPELIMSIPTNGIQLINWNDAIETFDNTWFDDFVTLLDSTLWTDIDDPSGPNGNGRDLGINVLLRLFLLDNDRAWTFNTIDDIPFFETNEVFFEKNDTILNTKIFVNEIRIFGLDTFTSINPLTEIGTYTMLFGPLNMDHLTIELGLTLEVQLSNDEDSLFSPPPPPTSSSSSSNNNNNNNNDKSIIENLKLTLSAKDISFSIAFLIALKEHIISDMNIIYLLLSNNLVSCFRSALYNFQVTGINFDVTSIELPIFNGFDSIGLKHLFEESTFAAYNMYEETLLQTANTYFQSKVRNTLNDAISNGTLFAEPENYIEQCSSQGNIISDPLSGQIELEKTINTTTNSNNDTFSLRLMDFTTLAEDYGDWADTIFDGINSYLGGTVTTEEINPYSGEYTDLQINMLLRSWLDISPGDEMSIEDLFEDDNNDDTIPIQNVQIFGLDSISEVDLLSVIAPQTFNNRLKWEKISLEMELSLGSVSNNLIRRLRQRSLQTTTNNQADEENFSISLELSNVELTMATFLAIDLDVLEALKLGSLMDTGNIVPCLLSSTHSASITQLKLDVGSLTNFVIGGVSSTELTEALSDFVHSIEEEDSNILVSALETFIDSTVRDMLNDMLDSYRTENNACPIRTPDHSSDPFSFVDFRQLFLTTGEAVQLGAKIGSPYGDLFRLLHDFIQDVIFEVDPLSGLSNFTNDFLIGSWTESHSGLPGSLRFGELLDIRERIRLGDVDLDLDFEIKRFRIDGVDTVGAPISMLDPVIFKGHELNNVASLGVNQPLRASARVLFSLETNGTQIRNEVDLSIDFHSITIVLQALLKIAESRLFKFPLGDIVNIDCWLATIPAPDLDARGVRKEGIEPTASLVNLVATIANLNVTLDCITCTSPKVQELLDLIASPNYSEDLNEALHELIDFAATNLEDGPFLQVQIDRLLTDASRRCPHSPTYFDLYDRFKPVYEDFATEYDDNSTMALIIIGVVFIAAILSITFLLYAINGLARECHRTWLETLPDEQINAMLWQQDRDAELEKQVNKNSHSMFLSPEVPVLMRWSMPLIILGNIALFLSGHLNLGATVDVEAQIAGDTIRINEFFTFSIARSTLDLWRAGAKELAILILIFSGIWPYTKQFISFFAWFLPPSILSIRRRGSIFLWLDRLAKWSMVDVFVLVISVAAFRISFKSPDIDLLPDDFYSLELLVVPVWGLYANFLAQLISQISSHFIIHYHRQILRVTTAEAHKLEESDVEVKERPNQGQSDEDEEAPSGGYSDNDTVVVISNEALVVDSNFVCQLSTHKFSRLHKSESLAVRPGMNSAIVFTGFSVIVLVLVGCILPSFSLDLIGLVALAIEFGQDFAEANFQHSIFTVIRQLMDQARFLDIGRYYVGFGTLSMLLLISVLLIPILQTATLMYQWFSPMALKKSSRWAAFNEVLRAWQYSEVYLLSIFVASWQLGPVSEFMINSYCEDFRDMLSDLVYFGFLKPEDAQCFRVNSAIEKGAFVLVAGAIVLAVLNSYVMKAVLQTLRDNAASRCKTKDVDSKMKYESTDGDSSDLRGKVHLSESAFTDVFRWTLCRESLLRTA